MDIMAFSMLIDIVEYEIELIEQNRMHGMKY
jgi:hypothetical protein